MSTHRNDDPPAHMQEIPPCEVCGLGTDLCECDPCPYCLAAGDPYCLINGGPGCEPPSRNMDHPAQEQQRYWDDPFYHLNP